MPQKISHVTVRRAEVLKLNIWRIADHGIEATALEDLWERLAPLERTHPLEFGIAIARRESSFEKFGSDEAVSFADIVAERRQWPVPRAVCSQRASCAISTEAE